MESRSGSTCRDDEVISVGDGIRPVREAEVKFE